MAVGQADRHRRLALLVNSYGFRHAQNHPLSGQHGGVLLIVLGFLERLYRRHLLRCWYLVSP
jgi:hypothetical protein